MRYCAQSSPLTQRCDAREAGPIRGCSTQPPDPGALPFLRIGTDSWFFHSELGRQDVSYAFLPPTTTWLLLQALSSFPTVSSLISCPLLCSLLLSSVGSVPAIRPLAFSCWVTFLTAPPVLFLMTYSVVKFVLHSSLTLIDEAQSRWLLNTLCVPSGFSVSVRRQLYTFLITKLHLDKLWCPSALSMDLQWVEIPEESPSVFVARLSNVPQSFPFGVDLERDPLIQQSGT